jgi:phage-related protein
MEVHFFQTPSGRYPVRDFIYGESKETQKEITEVITFLKKYGLQLPEKYLKKLSGTKNLWELRIYYRNQYRIILAKAGEGKVVLLSAFIKKRQKTPKKEITIAQKRLALFEIYTSK